MEQSKLEEMLLNQIAIPARLLERYAAHGLDEADVMVVLQLQRFLQSRNHFPTPSELSSALTLNETQCSAVLRKLIQKGMLAIKQLENEENQLTEAYSLEPLWDKLFEEKPEQKEETLADGSVFLLFEQEFGRPLSPFEIEMINTWIDGDNISLALIKAGLREAVLMGKLNFKYIDRILREWKQKGVKSPEQAKEASKPFRKNMTGLQQPAVKKRDTSFYYNWLEEEGD